MAKKNFKDLSEREILALAIQLEEEDSRVYGDFAEDLQEKYPATAKVFREMQAEESRHWQSLIDLYQQLFGDHIPLIRRQDVKGFVERRPVWLVRPLGINTVRKQVEMMELETRRFYERALQRVSDPSTRKLLGDLAEIERQHYDFASTLEEKHLGPESMTEEEKSRRQLFMLQIIQPGLAGLMDGSVSTLAPIFAAAFATHKTRMRSWLDWRHRLERGFRWLCGRAFGRRFAYRPWETDYSRFGDWTNDGRGWARAHSALLDLKFSCGLHCGDGGGCCGACSDQLRSASLHGYAAAFIDDAGGCWRRGCLHCGHRDRKLLILP